MRALIILAGMAISLTACSQADVTEGDENALNTIDANMVANDMDMNATAGLDNNMATNAGDEANMVANDMNTNDPDTNLANGM